MVMGKMNYKLVVLILGFTLLYFGVWYDMPGIGSYANDKAGGMTFVSGYQRGVGGFLTACGLSLVTSGFLIFYFDKIDVEK
jgi:hypothetical protein